MMSMHLEPNVYLDPFEIRIILRHLELRNRWNGMCVNIEYTHAHNVHEDHVIDDVVTKLKNLQRTDITSGEHQCRGDSKTE